MPFDERKIICRRCAAEVKQGDIINVGVVSPPTWQRLNEENETYLDKITMSTESGMVGGVPSALPTSALPIMLSLHRPRLYV
jgi:propionate CoA-transferase